MLDGMCVYKLIYTPYKVMHRTSNVLNCVLLTAFLNILKNLGLTDVFNIKAYLIR